MIDTKALSALAEQIKKYAAMSDQENNFPSQAFDHIGRAGLLKLNILENPYRYAQGQTPELMQVLKMIGSASLPAGRIYEGHINALQLIDIYGDQNQKIRYFQEVLRNNSLFGVWNTEDQDGLRIIGTGNGKYKLEGAKTFCSGARWIDRPLVTGRLISAEKTGWQMCIIPLAKVREIRADSSFWKPLGMRGSVSYRMDFSGLILDKQDLLGPPDAYYREPGFSGGALRFAAVQLGGAQAIFEETVKFLKIARKTDDVFQKARIAEIAYLIETGNLWISRAAAKNDVGNAASGGGSEFIAYVNMTRMVILDVCQRCMQLAEHSVGARGLMKPYIMERLHRDLTTYLKQPAPDAALVSIGKYVLDKNEISTLWNL